MNRVLMAFTAISALALVSGTARASLYDFTVTVPFGGSSISAMGTIDEVGGQAISGSGVIGGGLGDLTLVTLATPGVHDLGSGILSYRFGGGTDLIGDTVFDPTATPIVDSAYGLIFMVSGPGDNGIDLYSNGPTDYEVFIAGDSIYQNLDGGTLTVSLVPEPTTIAILGLGLIGIGLTRRRA